jgi:hypothetical protein
MIKKFFIAQAFCVLNLISPLQSMDDVKFCKEGLSIYGNTFETNENNNPKGQSGYEEACFNCNIKEIWDLYGDFCKNQPDNIVGRSAREDYKRLTDQGLNDDKTYPNVLNKLTIELTNEEIKNIYKKFGVIQLRYIHPEDTKLLIGCGNNPILDFQTNHEHKGMVTINPELSMNPTIVGGFGVQDLREILPENHFSSLVEESINPIIYGNHEMLRLALNHTLKSNFKFYTVAKDHNWIPIHTEDGTDKLEEIVNELAFDFLTDSL